MSEKPIVGRAYLKDNRASFSPTDPYAGGNPKDAWKGRMPAGFVGQFTFDRTDQGKPEWAGGTDTARAPVSNPRNK